MYYSVHNGVYFVEGVPQGAKLMTPIATTLDGIFSQAQLKSLDDIKAVMARSVRRKGGNAVVGFQYGQKSSFWRSLLSLDDVRWEASGCVAVINPAQLEPKS